eukprot:1180561-Prorocentrum_minimum.AAC.4
MQQLPLNYSPRLVQGSFTSSFTTHGKARVPLQQRTETSGGVYPKCCKHFYNGPLESERTGASAKEI